MFEILKALGVGVVRERRGCGENTALRTTHGGTGSIFGVDLGSCTISFHGSMYYGISLVDNHESHTN